MCVSEHYTMEWVILAGAWASGMLPDAMSLPYFLVKRPRAPSSENRCCNVTESKIRKTAGWTSLHTTQTEFGRACSVLQWASHCQQYLFKTSTWPLRTNKLGAIGWCLLYKVVMSSSLEPAAARNCLALQESLHACSSLWNALIEGATNTYRSATALIIQQECINPNSGNGTADATSYIWQKCQACFLSALFIRSSASHGQQHSEQETVFRIISKQIPRKNWVGDHKIQAHFRGGEAIEKPDITCMQFFHILRT